ncbi:MAG: serine hydrolase domain-containing protein [Planctomycetota bacterium]|nr:serine hydrolase domain-containing protein [Planctomycetota bacterium]
MSKTAQLVAVLALFLLAAPAAAGELPRAEPKAVGLSADGLAKIDKAVLARLDKKEIAGAVTLVARNGKVAYFKSFGGFKKDSIVRIYSMSKPVTVAAALMLVDDGKLSLDDPVAKHLPGIAACAVEGADKKPATMTIRHLMQHTAGLTYGVFGDTPVDKQYRQQGILGRNDSLETMTEKLCNIPLLFEPGTRWHYSISIDLLGRVIEVVAKKPFGVFLKERLFDPLGMADTGFHVPADKLDRLVPNYGPMQFVIDRPERSAFGKVPAFESGGGGLVSTASDFMTFALMLANGGTWNGKQVLKPESVKLMTTNQLPEALVPIRFGRMRWKGVGFGLGVSVRVSDPEPGSAVGDWGWGGAASTTFFVSPSENLVMVNMLQRMPMWNALDRDLRPLVYASVEKREPVEAAGTK